MTQSQRTNALPAASNKAEPALPADASSKKAELRGMPFEAQVEALKPKGPDGKPPVPPPAPGSTAKTGAGPTGVVMSGGEQMIAVQNALVAKGYDVGPINGINAGRTKASIIEFQRANGLVPDGIVGRKTLAALGVDVSGMKASVGVGQLPQKEEPKSQGDAPADEQTMTADRKLWDDQNMILRQRADELNGLLAAVPKLRSQAGRDKAVGALNRHRAFNAFRGAHTNSENKPKRDFQGWYTIAFDTAGNAKDAYYAAIAADGAAQRNGTAETDEW